MGGVDKTGIRRMKSTHVLTGFNSERHWKNIYKSYHENIMFFREKIINCFLKIIIIMIFFSSYFSVGKKIIIIKIIFKKHILSFLD